MPCPRSRSLAELEQHSFITKTLEVQRKAIEKGERNQEADTDEEIEAGMQNTKTTLAQEFDERNAKKVGHDCSFMLLG